MMSLIPFPYRVLIFFGLLASALTFGYVKGRSGATAEYEARIQKAQAEIAALQLQAANQSVKVVTKYIDRVKVVRDKGDTIIQEVPVYVPSDSCAMPAGFRVLHDAAARGELPQPAGIADAAPVAAQDAAATVASNYTACHANTEQLIALQEWVKAVAR